MASFIDELAPSFMQETLPGFLSRQRWFGAKSKTVASVTFHSASPVETQDDECEASLSIVSVIYEDGSTDLYQLPLAKVSGKLLENLQKDAAAAFIALPTTPGPKATAIVDATAIPAFRAALLGMVVDSADASITSRVTSAEQSNTSVIYGDEAILKLYRRLQTGENPDVEISRFLTQEAHFGNIPAYLGQLRGQDGSTLAFLQAFAANDGDGWEWTQKQLATFYKTVVTLPAPVAVDAASFLHEAVIPIELTQYSSATLEAATLLGRRTAEMHLALATQTDDPAFCAEAFTPNDLASDSQRISTQITSALEALKSNLARVPTDLTDRAAQLLGRRKDLLERAHTLATASPYRFGRRIRIHGDYHLGQVLRTADDFLIVDFEGEPARPLEERRRKQSPLRDVAGMLRSFSYAAHAALNAHTEHAPENATALEAWATLWERGISSAFLAGYRRTVAANPELLPQPEQAQAILLALLLEKALYELLYELNNRPSWLRIPLGGVLSLLREAA